MNPTKCEVYSEPIKATDSNLHSEGDKPKMDSETLSQKSQK